jgi:phosphonate transport system substrate-binding protein
MKKLFLIMLLIALSTVFVACGSTNTESTETSEGEVEQATEETATEEAAAPEKEKIVMVWLPNESGADLKDARDEFGKIIEDATGIKVEHQLTTDYLIAVEAMANDNADLAFVGAQAYVEANNKNSAVQPLFVPSGASGTLDDAVYFAWLAVNKGEEAAYQSGDQFAIDNIAGKRFSWVSTSSTSGFKVPAAGIVSHFSKMDQYKSLVAEDLLEGGKDKFFNEVLFGNSHQGSAVNLLSGKADVGSFCDVCVINYIELASGEENKPGAVYKVLKDAAEPFNTVVDKEFVVIQSTPVLNAPFIVNTNLVSEELAAIIQAAFLTDEVANNPQIFIPKDSELKGLFKKTKDERFVVAEDAWFNPIRELSK